MKIGFIINDLNSMNLEKDTSVYLMKEAHARVMMCLLLILKTLHTKQLHYTQIVKK